MNIKLVKCTEELPRFLEGEQIGLDVETSGLTLDHKILTINLYDPTINTSYIIDLTSWDISFDAIYEAIHRASFVGFNLQFDLSFLQFHLGWKLKAIDDVMLMARMMQFSQFSLKDIAKEQFPSHASTFKKLDEVVTFDKEGVMQGFDLSNPDVLTYCALDAYLPVVLRDRFKSWEVWQSFDSVYQLEMDFLNQAVRMKAEGLRLDWTSFDSTVTSVGNLVSKQQEEFNAFAGRPVKVNSPKDMQKALFEDMQLPPTPILTGTGAPSTNAEALSYLEGYPAIDLLVELKRNDSVFRSAKTIRTFRIGERVHPNIEQLGIDGTSRVYSKDPSVNQWPWEMRASVVPEVGNTFYFLDWSGAELLIAAAASNCTTILDWYEAGVDLHTEIANFLKSMTPDWYINHEVGQGRDLEITREASKVVTFAVLFGSIGGSVARKLKISDALAQHFVKAYLDKFYEIRNYREDVVRRKNQLGYTQTLLGRRRTLPMERDNDPTSSHSNRQAFNTAIQGSCADFYKLAISRGQPLLEKLGGRVVFGVFDSFLLEVPSTVDAEEVTAIMEKMCDFTDILPRLKFNFDVGVGSNWLEAKNNA